MNDGISPVAAVVIGALLTDGNRLSAAAAQGGGSETPGLPFFEGALLRGAVFACSPPAVFFADLLHEGHDPSLCLREVCEEAFLVPAIPGPCQLPCLLGRSGRGTLTHR
jgi:hypothetical protein